MRVSCSYSKRDWESGSDGTVNLTLGYVRYADYENMQEQINRMLRIWFGGGSEEDN